MATKLLPIAPAQRGCKGRILHHGCAVVSKAKMNWHGSRTLAIPRARKVDMDHVGHIIPANLGITTLKAIEVAAQPLASQLNHRLHKE